MTNPLIRRTVHTRRQLVHAGYTDSEIKRAAKASTLQRLSWGVYVDGTPDTLQNEMKHRLKARALAANSPQLVVSHISALLLHGIAVWGAPLGKIHLTRRAHRGASQSRHRIVHAVELVDTEIVEKDGVRMTSVARSLLDFARTAPHASAVIALDAALQKNLVTAEQLVQAYGRVHGRRGAPAVRRALLAADGRSESVGETRTRLIFKTLGLPTPELQVSIFDESGEFVGRTDLGFPELGVLIEFDGAGKYSVDGRDPRESLIAEKAREDALRQLGWVVVRLVWLELADLPAMLAKIRAALKVAARRQELGGCSGSYRTKERVVVL